MMERAEHNGSRFEQAAGFSPDRADYYAGIFMLVTLVVFFAPALLGGGVFYFRDICSEIVPKRTFLVGSGWRVLWNPYTFFGLPLAANMQEGAFYPLNFIFHLGWVPRALSFYIPLHFAIGLFFCYALLRGLKHSAVAAAAGALAFAYGGFSMSLGNQVVVLNSATWIMPLLWAAARALRTGRKGFVVWAGIFWAVQVLGGEPEIAYLSGLVLLIFVAGLIVSGDPGLSVRDAARRGVIVAAGAGALAVGLSAGQWLLTLELTGLSNRAGGLGLEEVMRWSLEVKALATLVAPNYIMDLSTNKWWALGFRNSQLPYLLSVYPGVSALFLALLGLSRRRRDVWVFAAGSVTFIVLSLGAAGGLYKIFYYALPGFDRFRFPERMMYGFAALFPLLVASGVTRLLEWGGGAKEEGAPSSRRYMMLLGFMLLAAALMAVVLFVRSPAAPQSSADYYAYHLELLRRSGLRSALFIILSCALLVMTRLSSRSMGRLAGLAVCLVIFLDLYSAHRYVCPTTGPDFYDLKGNQAQGLPGGGRGLRVLLFLPDSPAELKLGAGRTALEFYRQDRLRLQGFTALELGIREAGSRSSFYPEDVDKWITLLNRMHERLMALGGVRWGLKPGYAPVEIKDALPRAFVAPEARWFPDQASVLRALEDPGFDGKSVAYLEGSPPKQAPPRLDNLFWPMKIMRDDNQDVEVLVENKHSGYLVLLDSFYPGWHARVNGKEVPIYRANGFFRAVPVGQDGGRVEFYYRPVRLWAGLILSGSCLLLCLVILLKGRAELAWWAGWAVILVILPMDDGGTTYLPVTALRIMALVMCAAWAWRPGAWVEPRFYRTRLDAWIMGFWFLAAVALWRSAYFYISFYWYLNIFTLVLLFYFTVQFTAGEGAGARRARGILLLLTAGYAAQAAWAVAESVGKAERASAGYFNPGFLAGALMAVSPYALARALGAARQWAARPEGREGIAAKASPTVFWAAVFLLLGAGIVATQSRAVVVWPAALMLVGLPGVEGVLTARGYSAGRARRLALGTLAGGLAAAAVALAVVPNPLKERARIIGHDPYAFERVRIWESGLRMIKDHPLGTGLGMYKYYFHPYNFPVDQVMAGRYEKRATDAHHEYIGLAAEMSPLAPLLLIVLAVMLVLGGWKAGRAGPRQAEVLGAAAGVLAIALHAWFDSNLHNHSIAVLAVVLSGLLVSELGRGRDQWTFPLTPGARGKWPIRVLFALLLAGGTAGYGYLGWSYGLMFKASEEPDPEAAMLRLLDTAKYAAGNATHFKQLAQELSAQYLSSGNLDLLSQALKAEDTGIRLNPADPGLRELRGKSLFELYRATGQAALLDRARAAFNEALARDPFDVDSVLSLATLARRAGGREEEVKLLGRALELEPYDLAARLRLARALFESGQKAEARQQMEELASRRREIMEREREKPAAFVTAYRQKRIRVDENELAELQRLVRDAAAGPGPRGKVNRAAP
ncbi:MAG TPA: O-antigen ligase family protein [bacterium]|nr:O-antigen ligase family protein [bacterium]